MLGVAGDYAVAADPDSFIKRKFAGAIRNDIARLNGYRIVRSAEIARGKELDVNLIERLTGRDTATARFLYEKGRDFMPTFKLWICSNNLPTVEPEEDAFWRRIVVVPFKHVVAEDELDPTLKDNLKRPNTPKQF